MRSVIYLPAALLPLALFLVSPGGAGTGTNPGNHAGNSGVLGMFSSLEVQVLRPT
ncbi:MAG TPA: hypothetical protein VIY49_32720 [Bryobacteraceae bacterium]